MKKFTLALSALAMFIALPAIPGVASAQTTDLVPGQIVKADSSPAVYYIDEDLTRHVFPNARIFASWYANFDGVVQVSDDVISRYPLAGNVPYKASKRLVKLQTDPKVYAIDDGGTLRWIKSERVARALYGEKWNTLVDDLSDAFFVDYTVGDDIDGEEDFDARKHEKIRSILETLRAKRLKHLTKRGAASDAFENRGFGRNKQPVCHTFDGIDAHTIFVAGPAVSAHLGHGDATGFCGNDRDDDDNGNAVAPVISDVTVTDVTATAATVSFVTDKDAQAKVYFSKTNPVDVGSADYEHSVEWDTDHEFDLTGLEPETTYYFIVKAWDGKFRVTAYAQRSFTTDEAEVSDTTDPDIEDLDIVDVTGTTATVSVDTDEDTTAKVYFSASTPVNTATAAHVDATTLDDSHDIHLTGLAAGTVYHVLVVVKDAAGNETISDEESFTTLETDTTDPVVEDLDIVDVTGTTATVSVDTDEDTTIVVYYSTTSPVNTATAAHVDATTLDDSHDIHLTGLAAGTGYFVLVIVEDEAGNETAAEETSFTTDTEEETEA